MELSPQFANELNKLRGVVCWGIVAGEGTGSHVTLHFGAKIERARPLPGGRLPEDLRRFVGERVLFIQNCAWRLDAEKIICSSKSPNENEGVMVSSLQSLIGQTAASVSVSLPGHDLTVEFADGRRLRLFSDCFNQEHDGDNYSIHSSGQVFVVRAGGELILEGRRKP